MKEIKLYTWARCPHCLLAKQILDEKGLSYADINIDNDEKMHQQLKVETGQNTVPYVFIGDELVGGCSDLQEIVSEGTLENFLEGDK